jgi:hypothetical protein
MITSLEWDPMSRMTSDNEVEIWARSMEDEGEREVFYRNFGRHWNKEHNRFFRIPEERVDFQKKRMKGWPDWDRGHISKLVNKYDTMPIGRAKFLLALKEAAIQYVESEKNNATDGNDDIVEREEEEADSDHSPTFKREMERVDENMRRAPPRASQWMETRPQVAARRLEFELANLNAPVVHEIGESSSAAIMEISDSE